MKKTPKCLVPSCSRTDIGRRGLCRGCYLVARELVLKQRTTWEDLAVRGKCLPSRIGKPTPRVAWFLDLTGPTGREWRP